MATHTPRNIFMQGPLSAAFIADSIQKHNSKQNIGAHSIFLGQVRADVINGQTVTAIEYTAYESMANEQMQLIREEIFDQYPLICLHVYHSLGVVPAGEICLFVFASSEHRKAAIDACELTVEKIKTTLPVWGKEHLGNDSYQWKQNQPSL
jgi:molybdopterin synthase catalytic subunit